MAEAIGIGDPVREVETKVRYPNLRFEPGTHGANDGTRAGQIQAADQYIRFERGDPYAHSWNRELVKRIEATKPKIIAIDNLGFDTQFGLGKDETPTMIPPMPEETWSVLPTTPEKINNEGSVLVVAGDPNDIGAPFNYALNRHPDIQALKNALEKEEIQESSDPVEVTPAYLWTASMIDTAILASIAAGKITKKESKIVSRRNFLRAGGMAAVGGAAWLYFNRGMNFQNFLDKAADAPTEAAKQKWLDAVKQVDPELIKSKYIQLRTAVVALKLKDAVDDQHLPRDVTGSLIFGDDHIDAQNFLDDDGAAQNAIREYLGVIDPLITQALHHNPTLKREFVIEKIKSYLAKTYVQKVDQPDPETFFTREFPNAVSASIETVADFESKRIKAAVADFH